MIPTVNHVKNTETQTVMLQKHLDLCTFDKWQYLFQISGEMGTDHIWAELADLGHLDIFGFHEKKQD